MISLVEIEHEYRLQAQHWTEQNKPLKTIHGSSKRSNNKDLRQQDMIEYYTAEEFPRTHSKTNGWRLYGSGNPWTTPCDSVTMVTPRLVLLLGLEWFLLV